MRLTRYTCPNCEASLKFTNGIEGGKKVRCPKCHEPFVVTAAEEDEEEERVQTRPSAARPAKKVRPSRGEDARAEDEKEHEETASRKKRGKKKKTKPAFNPLTLLIIGGGVLLVGGGIGLYFLLAGHKSPRPSQVANKTPGDTPTANRMIPNGNPSDRPTANRVIPKGNPTVNPRFSELASRLAGRWQGVDGGVIVLYDYRSDGTFSLEVKDAARPVKATGTWKVTGVGKKSGRIQRAGTGDPSPYFKPNDTPTIVFNSDDSIILRTGNRSVQFLREEPEPMRTPEFMAAQEKAVAMIKKLGGKWWTKTGQVGSLVTVIDLSRTRVSNDDLLLLAPLANLRSLNLSFTQISDAGLAHLKGLTSIRSLKLNLAPVTDAGLDHLKGMTKMVELNLAGLTGVTDQGLAKLKGMTKLQFLMVSNTQVTGAGLASLKEMTRLEELYLGEKNLRDENLFHLKGLVNLQKLSLSESAITDAGLSNLDGLYDLEWVSVDHTQVGDEGLARLARLPNLRAVRAVQSRVTEAGVQRVRSTRPDLRVIWKEEP